MEKAKVIHGVIGRDDVIFIQGEPDTEFSIKDGFLRDERGFYLKVGKPNYLIKNDDGFHVLPNESDDLKLEYIELGANPLYSHEDFHILADSGYIVGHGGEREEIDKFLNTLGRLDIIQQLKDPIDVLKGFGSKKVYVVFRLNGYSLPEDRDMYMGTYTRSIVSFFGVKE